jgi:hypothetical protein
MPSPIIPALQSSRNDLWLRLHVFKLKFGLKVLVSGLQSVTGSWFSMEKPKSVSWQLSSAGSITSSILGAS